jgi:hypothetical protein
LLRPACAGLSRFSVGVEQVGDTLPESGQETDWGKASPTCNLYSGIQQRAIALPAVESKTHTRPMLLILRQTYRNIPNGSVGAMRTTP